MSWYTVSTKMTNRFLVICLMSVIWACVDRKLCLVRRTNALSLHVLPITAARLLIDLTAFMWRCFSMLHRAGHVFLPYFEALSCIQTECIQSGDVLTSLVFFSFNQSRCFHFVVPSTPAEQLCLISSISHRHSQSNFTWYISVRAEHSPML